MSRNVRLLISIISVGTNRDVHPEFTRRFAQGSITRLALKGFVDDQTSYLQRVDYYVPWLKALKNLQ